ncbi:AbrB/MazE/SpoVT family DNA-binding domain-containing protein [Chitinimonas koreensis]|uniref:AbrB/MazE/SpoVT family DNA-binding domain-containing protein n=1 Tax=Chitinimonas koreensis TaxID=356302 RepID=UPI000408E443|nr:AbrB/MazE/SpoVT family DNA-binding domain-containing protein [Chitinimonas koreensis]QNM98819.1 AbrB/MazE/SpoVT family DNA-binding domain-containing protein [Chitinimonas koreensis]
MGAIVRLEHHRITLPDEVLAALKLEDGDALDVSLEGEAVRIVRRSPPAAAELDEAAGARLERLRRHHGAGRGAYADAAEADAAIRHARDEW